MTEYISLGLSIIFLFLPNAIHFCQEKGSVNISELLFSTWHFFKKKSLLGVQANEGHFFIWFSSGRGVQEKGTVGFRPLEDQDRDLGTLNFLTRFS